MLTSPLLVTTLTSQNNKPCGKNGSKNLAPAFVYRSPDVKSLEIEGFNFSYTPEPLPVDRIIASIRGIYSDCVQRSKSKAKFHRFFQLSLQDLAAVYGFLGVVEYDTDRGDYRIGRVDVAWLDEFEVPMVAIEIDNANNKSAISKLQNSPANLKIWIYYGQPELIRSPKTDNILVISARSKGEIQ